ncbi:MAG: hypothetical protein MI700_08645 [Balneolales bacterium]|nr:hypothetical protein [Balneolales bacterium]
MRSERVYIAFLVLSIVVYVAVELTKPKPVDWSDDFTRNKSIPYATEILFNEIETLFPNQEIIFNEESIFVSDAPRKTRQNWVFLNSGFVFDEQETELLFDQVNRGDQVFIAGVLSGFLADTLSLEFEYYYSFFDSAFTQDSISLGLQSELLGIDDTWRYDADGTYFHIVSYDSSKTTELGRWENGHVNFIKMDVGEGSFYINSTPYLFTNYYLRKPKHATYAFTALSHLPIRNTVWDIYYKDGKPSSGTPLYVILNTEYLNYAWYTALVSLVLFMIFRAKRRQRIIPTHRPLENSTLEFTKTIGNLYQEQGTHKEILEKKVQFFFEYVNSHLRLDTSVIDEKLRIDVSFRSGVERQQVFKLFDAIEFSQNTQRISDRDLKQVTDQIDQFYKHSQR